jgi:hypothetical protein
MHALRSRATLLALAALPALAACDGGGGTDPARLTPGEVGAVYSICTLRFAPSNAALPVADVLASGVANPAPAGKPSPTVTLSPNAPQYEVAYTRKSDSFLQLLRGSVDLHATSVSLSFPTSGSGSDVSRELLLPAVLDLQFAASPRMLSASPATTTYGVRRSDYAKAAGISEEGLQDQIFGTLTARFQAGGC